MNGLLVDTDAMKVRYVELVPAKDLAADDDHQHAIRPIGTARLDDDQDEVAVNRKADVFRTLPPYTRGVLSREQEQALMRQLVESVETTSVTHVQRACNFYEQLYVDDRSPFAGRRSRSGVAELLGAASLLMPVTLLVPATRSRAVRPGGGLPHSGCGCHCSR